MKEKNTSLQKLLLICILMLSSSLFSIDNHFNTVWSGNGYQQMNFYFTSADINTIPLTTGDEIAVFDGINCVGMTKLINPISQYQNHLLPVIASYDDPSTTSVDGYIVGHSFTFKIWKLSTLTEYSAPNLVTTNHSTLNTFQIGGTAVISLSVSNYPVNAIVYPANAGIVSGLANYNQGSNVIINAQANENYAFTHWTDNNNNLISTLNPYAFQMPGNQINYIAHFEKIAPPMNVTGTAGNAYNMITWDPADTTPPYAGQNRSFSGYLLYRDNQLLTPTPISNTFFKDNNVIHNQSYDYCVTAVYQNPNNESVTSNIFTLVANVQSVLNLTATPSSEMIALNWQTPEEFSSRFDYYEIFRNDTFFAQTSMNYFDDISVTHGITYTYYIVAHYNNPLTQSDHSNSATAVAFVNPPLSLTYSIQNAKIILNWLAPENYSLNSRNRNSRDLISYNIYRDNLLINNIPIQNNTYTDNTVLNNTEYEYKITAVYGNPDNESDPTDTIHPLALAYAPENFSATPSNEKITLNWVAPSQTSDRFSAYCIYRNDLLIAETSQITYEDHQITHNEHYNYYVIAKYDNPTTMSDHSNSVNTMGFVNPPTSLVCTVGNAKITLNWQAPANLMNLRRNSSSRVLISYNIYRDDLLLNNAPVQTTSFVDNSVLHNTNYQYKVTAVYGSPDNESDPTETFQALALVQYPGNLTAVASSEKITLNWQTPTQYSDRLSGYSIYKNDQFLAQTNEVSYIDQQISHNEQYSYYIIANYSNPETMSDQSNTASATAFVSPPASLSYTIGNAQITLNWQAPNSNLNLRRSSNNRVLMSYNIYRNNILINNTPVQSTSFIDNSVIHNTLYQYKVSAVYDNPFNESDPTETVQAIAQVLAPSNLTATPSSERITLNWTSPAAPSSRLTGYSIYKNNELLTDTDQTSYIDHQIIHNEQYSYYIIANYSDPQTASDPSNSVAVAGYVQGPMDLSVMAGNAKVTLNWIGITSQNRSFSGYMIYRDGVLLNETPVLNTFYVDSTVEHNHYYSYNVKALYDPYNLSDVTNTEGVTAYVLAPSNFTVVAQNETILLNWAEISENSPRFNTYKIYRNDAFYAETTNSSFIDHQITHNSIYQYQILAEYLDPVTYSDMSDMSSAVGHVNEPLNLNVINHNASILLSWESPLNTSRSLNGFNIYRNDVLLNDSPIQNLSYMDSTIGHNSLYTYYVKAVYSNPENISDPSNYCTIIGVVQSPQNLSYTVSNERITLNWLAPSETSARLNNYSIFRDGISIGETTNLTFVDNQIIHNQTYSYYVVANYNDPTTASDASNSIQAIGSVYPPTNLSTTVGNAYITIQWQAPPVENRTLTGYHLFRDNIQLNSQLITSTQFIDDTVINHQVYVYYVKAIYTDLNNESDSSLPVQATAMVEGAQNLVATSINEAINLSWDGITEASSRFNNYAIYRNNSFIAQTNENHYTDTQIENNLSYEYYVVADYINPSTLSDTSNVATANGHVNEPVNLTGIVGNASIELNWSSAISRQSYRTITNRTLVGYRVYRNGSELTTDPIANLTFSDNTVENDSIYTYFIRACYSNPVNISNNSNTFTTTAVVDSVNNLTGIALSERIILHWSPIVNPSSRFNAYQIYRNNILLSEVTDTLFTDQSIANNQTYNYYIICKYLDPITYSAQSNTFQINGFVSSPTNLIATVNNASIHLEWQYSSQTRSSKNTTHRNIAGFKIYRNQSLLAELSSDTLSYNDISVIHNQEYSYYVTAVYSNPDNESDPSDIVTETAIADAPINLAGLAGMNEVYLNWEAPVNHSSRLIGYNVYRNYVQINTNIVDTLSFHDVDLDNDVPYVYHVTAVYSNPLTESSPSDTIIATPHEVANSDLSNLTLSTKIHNNYPNPFNPITNIVYSLKNDTVAKLVIYNVKGQKVKMLLNNFQSKGNYKLQWNGSDDNGLKCASGIYFVRLITNNHQETRKILMMK